MIMFNTLKQIRKKIWQKITCKTNYNTMLNYQPKQKTISCRELEKQYNAMLLNNQPNDKNTANINCYECTSCGQVTKTIDIEPGTTPFIILCFYCTHAARSTFYKDVAPQQKPVIEFYRPTLKQCYKLRKSPAMLEHILAGGLVNRKIKP